MGISEACYAPAALALIADYHGGGTKSRAVGLHQMAIYCGIIVGGFSGYVADAPALGWRWAFDITGLLGILYSVPLFLFLRDAPGSTAARAAEDLRKPSFISTAKELLSNGSFLLLVLYFTLPALAGWVVRDWMPVILKDKFNIGQGVAGVSATLYVNIASICGAVLGGWAADRWMKRSVRGRIFTSALGMSLFIPALFGVGSSGTLTLAIFFLAVFGMGWGMFDCNNMPILSQVVRPELRATGYGLMNLVSISFGGFADWIFGSLRDRNVPLMIVFGVFAGAALLSIVIVLFVKPRRDLEQVSRNSLT
jgi:MFS family permease